MQGNPDQTNKTIFFWSHIQSSFHAIFRHDTAPFTTKTSIKNKVAICGNRTNMLVNDFLLNKTLINRVGFLQFTNITINVMYTAFNCIWSSTYDAGYITPIQNNRIPILRYMSLYTSNEYNVKYFSPYDNRKCVYAVSAIKFPM